MDKTEAAILSLVRCELVGEKYDFEMVPDWSKLYSIAFRQGIISIVYNAIKKSDLSVPTEFLRLFQVEALKYVRTDYCQRKEIQLLFQEFEKAGIRNIPLKGIIMKNMYPKPEYRWMSDADIMIDETQLDQIKPLMKSLGYSYKEHRRHELTWEKNGEFHVELHTLALEPQNKQIDAYFDKSFLMADQVNGMRYQYNANDMLLYAVCHLSKHFIYDFGNLRNVIDVFYLMQDPSLDLSYVNQKLREWKLEEFFDVLQRAVNCWFQKKELDETAELFLYSVLTKSEASEDSWGVVSRLVRGGFYKKQRSRGWKIRYVFFSVFLPYRTMKQEYAILERLPVLLPFLLVWRVIHGILFNRKHVKNYIDASFNYSETSVDQYMKLASAVGLLDMLSSEGK